VLTENRQVKQEPGLRRRWFEDDGLELIVWYGTAGDVDGFQLCYELADGGHALTWRRETGFARNRVDAGDATPLKNQTPVLTPEAGGSREEVAKRFRARSAGLESSLREMILHHLETGR
jgi:hypothetical protein